MYHTDVNIRSMIMTSVNLMSKSMQSFIYMFFTIRDLVPKDVKIYFFNVSTFSVNLCAKHKHIELYSTVLYLLLFVHHTLQVSISLVLLYEYISFNVYHVFCHCIKCQEYCRRP